MKYMKQLTDTEMVEIVASASSEIDDADQYARFLEDLGGLIADNFGGDRGKVEVPDDALNEWTCSFHHNEGVPPDGGVFQQYDTDVSWAE